MSATEKPTWEIGPRVPDEWIEVDSSNIHSFAYRAGAQVLRVRFRRDKPVAGGGIIYEFQGVDPSLFEELRQAASKGSFFASRVKDKFQFVKVPAGMDVTPETMQAHPLEGILP